jgi:hypothetical protein
MTTPLGIAVMAGMALVGTLAGNGRGSAAGSGRGCADSARRTMRLPGRHHRPARANSPTSSAGQRNWGSRAACGCARLLHATTPMIVASVSPATTACLIFSLVALSRRTLRPPGVESVARRLHSG